MFNFESDDFKLTNEEGKIGLKQMAMTGLYILLGRLSRDAAAARPGVGVARQDGRRPSLRTWPQRRSQGYQAREYYV
jgi:hypothetical protein